MAGLHIHLAVAKRYLEKNNLNINEKEYYQGVLSPDLTDDKSKTHYSIKTSHDDLVKYLNNKVNLYTYLKTKYNSTIFELGVFIHLITDYLFFNEYFDSEYLTNIGYENFCKDLYYSYNVTNDYITQKYNLDLEDYIDVINENIKKDIKKKKTNNEAATNILPTSTLDDFIERVASINLEEYKNKIIENKENILP